MVFIQTSFQKPCFKNGVFLTFNPTEVRLRYQNQGCSIDLPSETQTETIQFFQLLQNGGYSVSQLQQSCPQLAKQIPELLDEFDQRKMLTESPSKLQDHWMSGAEFYQDLIHFLQRFYQYLPPSVYTEKMEAGTITRHQLIGYALESYHVTHLCPSLLAPALTKSESLKTRKLLREFFASELHHDRLLENSLQSVGINSTQLEQMQPLPMTFAICTALAVFAQQHPLSFKAALLLFELNDESFNQLFQKSCDVLELPQGFYQPILLHTQINDDGDHEQMTKNLLSEITVISPGEQLLVKKNMAVLVESMIKRTHEILDYYGNLENPIPRCFI